MDELVSIIIPTYNGAEKLKKTLAGIRLQTYSNYEILVVDDNGAGTEEQKRTEAVLADFPEVRYFVHPVNRNGSAARNTGIRHAKGEYLAFLDDDDVWKGNKLEEQIKRFRQLDESWGLVYSPYILVESEKEARLIDDRKEGSILYEFLVEDAHIACSTIMVRREAVESVNGFDESFRRHQDWEFIARIAAKYKIACAPDTVILKYAVRRNSPKELETLIRNRLFYLDKMSSVIGSLLQEQQKQVYDYHYAFLAKECFRRRKFLQCGSWMRKTRNPAVQYTKLFADILKYMARKACKRSPQVVLEQTGLYGNGKG